MNWLQPGQRVFVEEREARHAEKLHEYSHLPWDSIYNVMTLGKIGSITDISEDWQTVVVRFYLWSRSDEFGIFNDGQLMAVDVVWHARALRPLYKIHFEIGDHAVLEQFDEEGQLLNSVSESGYTPLMCAVADGNWTATVALLSLGAQRDVADANGNTLLHMAAERGHVMILEGLLMFLGNEVNRPNSDGDTPMHLAARGQHAACLDRLLNTNHLHSNIQNANGDSPMHIVCGLPESPTKIAMVGRLLANARLNLHLYNEDELTPVHIAISKDCHKFVISNFLIVWHLKILTMGSWALVQAGCPLNAQDCDGQTASHLLVRELNRITQTSRECNVIDLPNTVFYAINSCSDLINMVRILEYCERGEWIRVFQNLHDIASRVRPHWQLACLCFLAARGADMTVM
ncbi:hypothetical protein ANCCEY_02464 [Ancylostoma ceylanicum]|uniref:Uncharacterized protein n=1 Tax=Ancylostoma ceylanicum TaxID=53326 RepID=A0A0D6M313_9BILA|nr:hypothetical protein ANCCEY_02464 [Ancylostoma ceylanicum]